MNMKEKLTIIKVGGKIVEEEDSLHHLLAANLFIAAIIHFRIQSFPAPTLSENFP